MSSSTDLMIEPHSDHARALWGFALRLTGGDRSHAEDVVQETLLRAWRDRRILASTTAGIRAWLFTVVRRLVIDEWRSNRFRCEILAAEPPEAAVPAAADGLLEGWLVSDAFARLSTSIGRCWCSATSAAGRSPRPRRSSASRRAPSSRARTTRCARCAWFWKRWG